MCVYVHVWRLQQGKQPVSVQRAPCAQHSETWAQGSAQRPTDFTSTDRPPCLSEGPSELLGALSVGVLGSRGGRRLLCAAVTILVLGGTSASSQAVFKTATRKRLIMKTPNIEELSTFPGCSRPRSPTWRGEGNHSNDAPHTGRLGDPSPKITP